jgi:hypothetical protein
MHHIIYLDAVDFKLVSIELIARDLYTWAIFYNPSRFYCRRQRVKEHTVKQANTSPDALHDSSCKLQTEVRNGYLEYRTKSGQEEHIPGECPDQNPTWPYHLWCVHFRVILISAFFPYP